ncbi:MAG: Methionyl-tRNA formyltransferase [Candidatus Pacebacteria bacterium GW2011_GWA1_46_10]|nr:MAG: Methionyl-tRNA formyltransferase [Candidatus Pacebacteria bacterium GW2011_GWA1_46_10]HCR81629.1 hypothetical protein [Candidatus Paceibacterota bacterium]
MYTIAVAGSTQRTAKVAQTLLNDPRFQVSLVVTPSPKPVGRKQVLTQNPLHELAEKHQLPIILVKAKLDNDIRQQIKQIHQPTPFDFFLVVDFGFLVPQWLLNLPTIAPLNIHPSALPRWRGASPGQYVLLHGEKESAVTLMVMNAKMDTGPIIAQLEFKVEPTWTQTEYYQHSFDLICSGLGDLLEQFATGKLTARPQPDTSPTPLADRLNKAEAFRDWQTIKQAMNTGQQATELEQACRAYSPWPKLWTKLPTKQGEQRMIIHRCQLNQAGQLELLEVQLAGKTKTTWHEIKSVLKTHHD